MERPDPFEQQEVDAAAAEAGAIGGRAGDEGLDPAERPLAEGGEGYAEGFEQAEEELIEHASHGDQHSARMPLYHAGRDEVQTGAEYGEPDEERSSELDPDAPEEARVRDEPTGESGSGS